MATKDFDVVVVGAGLSGIDAGYHLQTSLPNASYTILEGRDRMGGTWDLFRYPGIRSDSDMYTLGFPFRPWKAGKAIADGPSILRYIEETAHEFGIDRKIQYRQRVTRLSWSSKDALWTLTVDDGASGKTREVRSRFVSACTGYYDYDAGYTPEFPGRERFQGRVVHPQKWTSDVDVRGKRVVVIGSGATAVTLVPELAKEAAHVTMLQRSPSYVMSVPLYDKVAAFLGERLSEQRAHEATRWKNVLIGMAFYNFCRAFPDQAKKWLVGQVAKSTNGATDVAAHFTPSYIPWEQRLCFVPDGDLFDALKSGRAEVVTDHIETFTERGLRLKSGKELEADVIVTATGLALRLLGGATIEIDGAAVDPSKLLVYKGMMLSDVPNLVLAIGYTNASWTLKCDLTSRYMCRLIAHMDARGKKQAVARRGEAVEEIPLIDFSSGYVKRALGGLPRQGAKAPWRLYQNYVLDLFTLTRARIEDGALELR